MLPIGAIKANALARFEYVGVNRIALAPVHACVLGAVLRDNCTLTTLVIDKAAGASLNSRRFNIQTVSSTR